MNARHTNRLIPRLEAMERRLPLSATTPTFHGVPAAHLRHSPQNPVILNLDPQATGIQITSATISNRFGLIGISGVVTFPPSSPPPSDVPSGPLTVSITVSISQDNGASRSGSMTSAPMKYVSTGFTTPFTLYVTPDYGKFRRGTAQVQIGSSWTNYISFSGGPSANAIVQLTELRIKPARS
jgi:hypothetical protein